MAFLDKVGPRRTIRGDDGAERSGGPCRIAWISCRLTGKVEAWFSGPIGGCSP